MRGILGQSLDWLEHPSYSDATVGEWLGGLVVILILSFLWTTVLRGLE